MKSAIIAGVVLVLLIFFNPGIEAHKEALELPFDKVWDEHSETAGWFEKFGLWLGGDELRKEYKSSILSRLDRKNCAIFSLDYINGELVTFGVLGYVHVFE